MRIDTGAEVNLMPASIYKLIYQENDLQKWSPCNLKIGMYTADTINIIGTMVIYLIHPDNKWLTKDDLPYHLWQRQCTPVMQRFTATWSHTAQTQTKLSTPLGKSNNE